MEEADAWFEYLDAIRGHSAARYAELEPWAWARLVQRLRAIGARRARLGPAAEAGRGAALLRSRKAMPRLFHHPSSTRHLRRAPASGRAARAHFQGDSFCHFPGFAAARRKWSRRRLRQPLLSVENLTSRSPTSRPRPRGGDSRSDHPRRKRSAAAAAVAARAQEEAGAEGATRRRPTARPRAGRAPRRPTAQADGADGAKRGRRAQAHARRTRASRRAPRRKPPRRAPLPEAKRELLVSVDAGEQRVAILEDGQVAEVYLERPERRLDRRQHLPRHGRQRAARHGGGVRRDRPREERLPLRRRDRRPRAREAATARKIQDLISARPDDPRPGGQGPDEDEGRAPDDRRSRCPAASSSSSRRARASASRAGSRTTSAPASRTILKRARRQGGRRHRPHRRRGRLRGGRRARPRLPAAALEDDRGEGEVGAKAPSSIYQEAELPLRVTRDLFTGDFEKAYVDDDRTYKRIVGYLKKTSPHMVERVDPLQGDARR